MTVVHPIDTRDLTKVFPPSARGQAPVLALDRCNLTIPRGAFYGLLGRNGEGKSTLMRCLLGLLHPTSGTARLLGMEYGKASALERSRVAYVPQRDQLAGSMTLRQYCTYYRACFPRWQQPYAEALIQRMRLAPDRPIGQFSGGIQRKVAICLALASGAEVLLLDEPAAGLDPLARRELISELIDVIALAEQLTVLFSTHILTDLENLADHIGILHQGRMALSEPLEALRARYRRVQLICASEVEAAQISLPEGLRVVRQGRVVTGILEFPEAVVTRLRAECPGIAIDTYALSLDELFIELVQTDVFAPVDLREVA